MHPGPRRTQDLRVARAIAGPDVAGILQPSDGLNEGIGLGLAAALREVPARRWCCPRTCRC
ncbi:MAG: hypothetical protein U0667_02730 [Chloroflexota bacterium]